MPQRSAGGMKGWLTTLAWCLAAAYALDRVLKLLAVHRFFRRPTPVEPDPWPAVTLLQPITRGASDLPAVLACRAALHYCGQLQHLLICDAGDTGSLATCRAWTAAHPALDVEIVTVDAATAVATKVQKLQAALPRATGTVLCFVDDDILLRPDSLARLVAHLQSAQTGSVFGLAVYTRWSNPASSLLSAFVNANALLSYIPLTYLCEPFTITGHFYALRRNVFNSIGGLDGMDGRFDDDHELARRVQSRDLVNVQTPVLYDVDNQLVSLCDYTNQMRRWFVIPRQTMVPYLNGRQQAAMMIGSAGNLLPPLLAALTLAGRLSPAPLATTAAAFVAAYAWSERRWLGRTTPPPRYPLVLLSACIAPLQSLAGLLGEPAFRWRGQRIRLAKGGQFTVIDKG